MDEVAPGASGVPPEPDGHGEPRFTSRSSVLIRSPSSVVKPGRLPSSRSAWRTQLRSVSGVRVGRHPPITDVKSPAVLPAGPGFFVSLLCFPARATCDACPDSLAGTSHLPAAPGDLIISIALLDAGRVLLSAGRCRSIRLDTKHVAARTR